MTTEFYIENLPVDMNMDLSSLLTFNVDDVKDFASRETTFSKTITIPGTARNNAIFGNIFDVSIANPYDPDQVNIGYNFNASKSANALLFQDNLQTFKGSVRLLQVNKYRGSNEYEIALNGEITNLVVAFSSAYLDELDFSAYDHALTTTNIKDSWDNPGGTGYYYPLIDYGNYGRYLGSDGKHDWDFRTFRPALYVKEYLDKMFEAAGYRYECELFSTTRFEHLIIPHNRKKLQRYVTSQINASRNDSANVIDSGTPQIVPLEMSSVVLSSSFTSTVGDSKFTYVEVNPNSYTFTYSFFGSYKALNNGWYIAIRKNGVIIPGTQLTIPQAFDSTTRFYTFSGTITITPVTDDYYEIAYYYGGTTSVSGTDYINASSGVLQVDSDAPTISDLIYGGQIQMNETLPKNVKQIDFFSSIIKLFNLYVYESKFDEKLILIEPFVDFYPTDSANAVDWTYKMNRDKNIAIKPLSEINSKTYNFNYKEDNDYYNELYRKRYNQGYGSYIFDSQFEFASQTSKVELVFAATPLVGYVGEDKVYPTIFKRSGPDNGPKEENIDSVIRIMQSKKVTGVVPWAIYDDVTVIEDGITDYGYAGHFDNPDFPNDDLNFGALKEIFFTLIGGDLSTTQFNVYWSPYMAEITDKDSKMLSARFYLTPADIFNLDFSKYVYVDGDLFRLNKITDYNATIPNDCDVQLLKVINTIY